MTSEYAQQCLRFIRDCLERQPLQVTFYDQSADANHPCTVRSLDARNFLHIAYTSGGRECSEELTYTGAAWYVYPGYLVEGAALLRAAELATGKTCTAAFTADAAPAAAAPAATARDDGDDEVYWSPPDAPCKHQWGPFVTVMNRRARECIKCHGCIVLE